MCAWEQRACRWESEPAVVAPNIGGSRLAARARPARVWRARRWRFGGIEQSWLRLIVDSNRSGNGAAVASEAMRSGGGTWGERWACSRYSTVYFMDRHG